MINRWLTFATNRIYTMPVLVLMPHSRCNCRCVMCDIWKSNHEKKEISPEDLQKHVQTFRKLGVRRVALSGGEALMHSNLWNLCDQLKAIGIKISLLSTGILLAANAKEIINHCDDVIVSLDGSREVHNTIRNIPSAFEKLEQGVNALRAIDASFPITGRCVLQKSNFRDLPNIIPTAKKLGLDQISFMAADISSNAFNHGQGWKDEKAEGISLTPEEARELEEILKQSFIDFRLEYAQKFIAEGPEKMRNLAQYYRAIRGGADFSVPKCNAPWVSAVIESNGDVMPCFFTSPTGTFLTSPLVKLSTLRKPFLFEKNWMSPKMKFAGNAFALCISDH